ncbi:MAG TPA: universal stress protein [Chloroflexota bacterium]
MLQAKRILVPLAGNSTDADIMALACYLAKRDRAKIYAINVIEVKRTLPLDAELHDETARGEAILEQAERVAAQWNQEIESEILQARDVGTAIVDEAIERNIDLILLGVVYKRRFGEFDLGRTVPYVLKNAPCRVWVCREPMSEG